MERLLSLKARIPSWPSAALFLCIHLSSGSSWAQDAGPLRLEQAIQLPGVEGRIDHFAADVVVRRVFVAALENGSLEVLDIRQGKRIAELKDLLEPQGAYYDAKTERLYVTTGGDGKLRIYDGKSLASQQTLEFGSDADNVRQDSRTGEIWIGYGNGGLGIVSTARKTDQSLSAPTPNHFSSRATEIGSL